MWKPLSILLVLLAIPGFGQLTRPAVIRIPGNLTVNTNLVVTNNIHSISGTVTAQTMTVTTEAYTDAGWNNDMSVATKDSIRDQIEAIVGGSVSLDDITDVDTGTIGDNEILVYDLAAGVFTNEVSSLSGLASLKLGDSPTSNAHVSALATNLIIDVNGAASGISMISSGATSRHRIMAGVEGHSNSVELLFRHDHLSNNDSELILELKDEQIFQIARDLTTGNTIIEIDTDLGLEIDTGDILPASGVDIIPQTTSASDLGSATKYWDEAWIDDLYIGAAATAATVAVSTEVYGSGWNADLTVPTKDAAYDEIETRVDTTGDTMTGTLTLTDTGDDTILSSDGFNRVDAGADETFVFQNSGAVARDINVGFNQPVPIHPVDIAGTVRITNSASAGTIFSIDTKVAAGNQFSIDMDGDIVTGPNFDIVGAFPWRVDIDEGVIWNMDQDDDDTESFRWDNAGTNLMELFSTGDLTLYRGSLVANKKATVGTNTLLSSIVFLDGSGSEAVVGIGTNAPIAGLHVASSNVYFGVGGSVGIATGVGDVKIEDDLDVSGTIKTATLGVGMESTGAYELDVTGDIRASLSLDVATDALITRKHTAAAGATAISTSQSQHGFIRVTATTTLDIATPTKVGATEILIYVDAAVVATLDPAGATGIVITTTTATTRANGGAAGDSCILIWNPTDSEWILIPLVGTWS